LARISLQGITKTFGEVVAIRDLTLEVHDREFLVMLGPSGAGKTTTLRTVAGLEKPDGGSVRIDGKSMERSTPAERNVAFVFQDYALYPFMTAYKNMAFPLKSRPMPSSEIDQRVRSIAAILQIEHLLQRKPAQLSGGEQQRVALGRAMVRRPQAFLMDEPLTNLDAKLRTAMRAELKHLHREIGATTLYVTHDQVEAMTMGDRIAVLRAGECLQVGTPDDVYQHPATAFVASFVGNPRMNLLAGTLMGGNDSWSVRLNEGAGTVPLLNGPAGAAANATSTSVIVGIRPENVAIVPQDEPGALPVTMYAVEPLGDRSIYDVRLGNNLIKVKTSPDFNLTLDEQTCIRFDPAAVHLFDGASQRRLVGGGHG
jgi:multiple sugar transport system ATP-binding protein